MKAGCKYGTHRVLSPKNALPQNADKIDNSTELYANEILIEVDTLNIDSASFHQMMKASNDVVAEVGKIVLNTVSQRGKQHNPVTGSGGMLLGSVKAMGPEYKNSLGLKPGDRIATLVSLSLTPLKIDRILEIFPEKDQIRIQGQAILFDSSNLAKIPSDLPENLVLSVLDVAGAPTQMPRLIQQGMTVVIIGGGGKSGILCLCAARRILENTGKLISVEPSPNGRKRLERLGYCDQILDLDATNPMLVQKGIAEITGQEMADLVINCANVDNTEMASVLSCKDSGLVYFFSMATSFTKVALGAEGVKSDARLLIGNGYAPDSAEFSLNLIRSDQELQKLFLELYA